MTHLRSRRRRHGLRRGAEGVPPSEVTPDSPEEPSSLVREPLWRKLKDLGSNHCRTNQIQEKIEKEKLTTNR